MGNHDGWTGSPRPSRRQFEKSGISFLTNQHSLLTIHGESLAIAGTDFVWLGKPDPERTLRGIPAETPVLALVHEPDYFDAMAARREILLQVSGHTHGGQCRVPVSATRRSKSNTAPNTSTAASPAGLESVRHPRRRHHRPAGPLRLPAGVGGPDLAGARAEKS